MNELRITDFRYFPMTINDADRQPQEDTMSKPLDCTGPIGKHDFRASIDLASEPVRRVGFRPEPQSALTPRQHLATVQYLVNRALLNGTMSRQEALKCKESLEEVAKVL